MILITSGHAKLKGIQSPPGGNMFGCIELMPTLIQTEGRDPSYNGPSFGAE